MAVAHPVFGVGPGNWAVEYPKFASRNDPSLNDEGMTSNPWPSSDWVAFVAERGFAAVVVYALALFGLLVGAWMRARAATDVARATRCGCARGDGRDRGDRRRVRRRAADCDSESVPLVDRRSAVTGGQAARHAAERTFVVRWSVPRWSLAVLVVLRSSGQIAAMSVYTSATTTRAGGAGGAVRSRAATASTCGSRSRTRRAVIGQGTASTPGRRGSSTLTRPSRSDCCGAVLVR